MHNLLICLQTKGKIENCLHMVKEKIPHNTASISSLKSASLGPEQTYIATPFSSSEIMFHKKQKLSLI